MRHLCQDVICHRITGSDIQKQPLSYIDEQMTMKKLQGTDKFVSGRQNNDLWIKRPSPLPDTGKGQNFNEYELVQDEYLKI